MRCYVLFYRELMVVSGLMNICSSKSINKDIVMLAISIPLVWSVGFVVCRKILQTMKGKKWAIHPGQILKKNSSSPVILYLTSV